MMHIRDLSSALDGRLSLSLNRFSQGAGTWGLSLPPPRQLIKRAAAVRALFDEGKPPEPPSQARINALGRLRQGTVAITRKDWHLIVWGLCDQCGHAGMPIDDPALFAKIVAFMDTEAVSGFTRKIWFGLLHSYFAYPSESPADNLHWRTLRQRLASTLPALLAHQARPKSWAQALERNSQLLTERAGEQIALDLASGDDKLANEVAAYIPVPEHSWLWRNVIDQRLGMLARASDQEFRPTIQSLLKLGTRHPSHADRVLATVLERYSQSIYRSDTHPELKQTALDLWQNPQVRTANRWSLVADDVRRMVLQWFAKADLEHFFSLLQGDGSVDHARLQYWLRFVDQISYTRIVMGLDAFTNQSADFIDFRTKNKGRFSRLTASNTGNNAFIMQIGEYYLVEFSGTGNACYVYAANGLPFNPENAHFTILNLKNKVKAIDRLIHNGAWEYKADIALARIGLRAGSAPQSQRINAPRRAYEAMTRPPPPSAHLLAPSVWPGPGPSDNQASPGPNTASHKPITTPSWPTPVSSSSSSPTPDHSKDAVEKLREARITQAIGKALVLAIRLHLKREDHRAKGGAFWILDDGKDAEVRKCFTQLGFGHTVGRGYWIR